jgi:hypothetical protein
MELAEEEPMRLLRVLLIVAILVCVGFAYRQTQPPLLAVPPTQAQTPATQEINDRFAKQYLERIAGKEKEPASRVFKNIQLPGLKDVPAANLINIMNLGYSRALGVTCTHCHVEQDFSSDEKRPKKAAREMAVMHRAINEQLGKMQSLEIAPQERLINCSTCHRGSVNPRDARVALKTASD